MNKSTQLQVFFFVAVGILLLVIGNGIVHAESLDDQVAYRIYDLTNEFRRNYGRSELMWDQTMANLICMHCYNMGEGFVAFGHDGFGDRTQGIPFQWAFASENVAMNMEDNDPAGMALDQWSHSQGHLENLLSDVSHLGIGAYRNGQGEWYLGQLFARAA
eukprot:GEZU01004172.1.p1 GENE.GEZU01004172.1~~GEZU01004172.1.p1  ORF type:complete len:160 (-),score=21.71 GEZU01004172.1:142-621(-)